MSRLSHATETAQRLDATVGGIGAMEQGREITWVHAWESGLVTLADIESAAKNLRCLRCYGSLHSVPNCPFPG